MQKVARHDKKYVPSLFEIEKLIPKDMICQDCNSVMHWIDDSNRAKGAVLQHYRDGSLGVVCFSCNTKHGAMVGDSYRDLPSGCKFCNVCKTIKPLSMFSIRRDGKKEYPVSKCKSCSLLAQQDWRLKNTDKYLALIKKHNDVKKLNPDKYKKLDKEYYERRKIKNGNISI
jgi:hypothetical protein